MSEGWFANSKHVEISYDSYRLGFCLASVLLKEIAKNVLPPEGNPIIQELFHDFHKNPFFTSEVPSGQHEIECLEYIKENVRIVDLEWHFQPFDDEARGIMSWLLDSGDLTYSFVDEAVPGRLYKYTNSANVENFIVNNSVFLSAPTNFNDPYDCPFSGNARERMDKIGITCFSSKNDNSLMFSHYSDEHRGVCLEFDPASFTSLTNRWKKNVGGRVQQVCYYDKFPAFDEDREPARIATAKHRDWAYEQEYRLTTKNADPHGAYTFKPEAFTGVIFGVRTPDEVKEAIYKMSVDAGRDITFYAAKKVDDSYNLDIVRVEFDEYKLKWIVKIS